MAVSTVPSQPSSRTPWRHGELAENRPPHRARGPTDPIRGLLHRRFPLVESVAGRDVLPIELTIFLLKQSKAAGEPERFTVHPNHRVEQLPGGPSDGERLATSGVLASLTAGIVVGNIGWRGYISQSGRGHVLAFWDYAAFLANSVIFIQIGLQEAHEAAGLLSRPAAIAIVLVLLGRAVAVYVLCPLFSRSHLAVGRSYQHILVWGGLRGALALVLALTLPDTVAERREIVIAAFAVVAFSIFVQGLTISPVIRVLGLTHRA